MSGNNALRAKPPRFFFSANISLCSTNSSGSCSSVFFEEKLMAKSNASGWLAFGYLFGMVAYCLGPAWSAQSIDAVSLFRVMFVIAVAIPVFGILKTTYRLESGSGSSRKSDE